MSVKVATDALLKTLAGEIFAADARSAAAILGIMKSAFKNDASRNDQGSSTDAPTQRNRSRSRSQEWQSARRRKRNANVTPRNPPQGGINQNSPNKKSQLPLQQLRDGKRQCTRCKNAFTPKKVGFRYCDNCWMPPKTFRKERKAGTVKLTARRERTTRVSSGGNNALTQLLQTLLGGHQKPSTKSTNARRKKTKKRKSAELTGLIKQTMDQKACAVCKKKLKELILYELEQRHVDCFRSVGFVRGVNFATYDFSDDSNDIGSDTPRALSLREVIADHVRNCHKDFVPPSWTQQSGSLPREGNVATQEVGPVINIDPSTHNPVQPTQSLPSRPGFQGDSSQRRNTTAGRDPLAVPTTASSNRGRSQTQRGGHQSSQQDYNKCLRVGCSEKRRAPRTTPGCLYHRACSNLGVSNEKFPPCHFCLRHCSEEHVSVQAQVTAITQVPGWNT